MKYGIVCLIAALMVLSLAYAAEEILVEMEFRNAPLEDVFYALGEIGGYNVLIDPSVTGTGNFFLRDLPVQEALDLVARVSDVSYTIVGQALIVASEERLRSRFGDDNFSFFALEHIDPEQGAQLVQMIVPGINIYTDRTRGLLVMYGTAKDLDIADRLLVQYDAAGALEAEAIQRPEPIETLPSTYGFFPLKAIDASKAEQLVRLVLPDIQIHMDSQLNLLVLFGSEKDMDFATSLVQAYDEQGTAETIAPEPEPEQPEPKQFAFHDLEYVPVDTVVQLLDLVLPNIVRHIDLPLNLLVVYGRKSELDLVQEVLEQYDHGQRQQLPPTPTPDATHFFRAEHVPVNKAQQLLQLMYPEIGSHVDEQLALLVLHGPQRQLDLAADVLTRYDGLGITDVPPPISEPIPSSLAFFPAENIRIDRAADLLETVGLHLQLHLDDSLHLVAIYGPEDQVEKALNVLQQYDARGQQPAEATPAVEQPVQLEYRFFQGQNLDVRQVNELLNMVIPGIEKFVHSSENLLVMYGESQELDVAERLLGELDAKTEPAEPVEPAVPVAEDVEELEPTAYQFFQTNRLDAPQLDGLLQMVVPDLARFVDAENNLLVMYGVQSHLDLALEMLEQFDARALPQEEPQQTPPQETEPKSYRFFQGQNLGAGDMETLLEMVVPGLDSFVTENSNILVLFGPQDQLDLVMEILVQLDEQAREPAEELVEIEAIAPEKEYRFFQPENIQVQQVDGLLQMIAPTVEGFADGERNLLVLYGYPDRLQIAVPLLTRFDALGAAKVEVKEAPVEPRKQYVILQWQHFNADQADALLEMVVPDVERFFDAHRRVLVLYGTEDSLTLAQALLAGFEDAGPPPEAEQTEEVPAVIRYSLFQGQHVSASQTQELVGATFPQLQTFSDIDRDLLVLYGKEDVLAEATSLLAAFDAVGPVHPQEEPVTPIQEEVPPEKRYGFVHFQHVLAIQGQQLTAMIAPELETFIDEQRNLLVLYGPTDSLALAESLLAGFAEAVPPEPAKDELPTPEEPQDLAIEKDYYLFRAQHTDVGQIRGLLDILVPDIESFSDSARNLLVLYGPTSDLELAREVLIAFDKEAETEDDTVDLAVDTPDKEIYQFFIAKSIDVAEGDELLQLAAPTVERFLDRDRNMIVLFGLEADVALAQEVLLQFDSLAYRPDPEEEVLPLEPPLPEVTYEVFTAKTIDVTQVTSLVQMVAAAVEVFVYADANLLVLYGPTDDVEQAMNVLHSIDRHGLPAEVPEESIAPPQQSFAFASSTTVNLENVGLLLDTALPKLNYVYDEALNLIMLSGVDGDVVTAQQIIAEYVARGTAVLPQEIEVPVDEPEPVVEPVVEKEPQEVEQEQFSWDVRYAAGAEIAQEINSAYSGQPARYDRMRSVLHVTATADELLAIKELVQQLDVPRFMVHGVIITEEASSVLIEYKGISRILAIGEELDGWTCSSISFRSVRFRNNGQELVVPVGGE